MVLVTAWENAQLMRHRPARVPEVAWAAFIGSCEIVARVKKLWSASMVPRSLTAPQVDLLGFVGADEDPDGSLAEPLPSILGSQ